MLGLLLSALRLKSLSSEVYYFKAEPQNDVAMLALIKGAPLKVTKL